MNCNFNWATPPASTSSVSPELQFEEKVGIEHYVITKNDITKPSEHTIRILNSPSVLDLPEDSQIFSYELPRSYINGNNEVIGTVYSTKKAVGGGYRFNNPTLTKNAEHYDLTFTLGDHPELTISDASPLNLYMLGSIRIEWLPEPTTLTTPAKIKCDLIEAKNALTLYESPIPVFFRPVNYGEVELEGVGYWWMTWGFENSSEKFNDLIEGQPFIFTESSFGHKYSLYKQGTSWTGTNMCTAFPNKTEYLFKRKDVIVDLYASNGEDIKRQLRIMGVEPGDNVAKTLLGRARIYQEIDDKEVTYTVQSPQQSSDFEGFDRVQIALEVPDERNYNDNINFDVTIQDQVTRWQFLATGYPLLSLEFEAVVNAITSMNYYVTSTIEPVNELKLYMKKDEVFKFTENNWDGTTNPFVYLNNVDGFNIIPDPSSSTSLTTPYSIVSNGVMLAENLQSHTYRINDLGNDITIITNQITTINTEIASLNKSVSDLVRGQEWYEIVTEKLIGISGSVVMKFLGHVIPIAAPLTRDFNPDLTAEWEMSQSGIKGIPQISFSGADTKAVSAIAYSTDSTIDDNTIPTTSWVNAKVEAVNRLVRGPGPASGNIADINAAVNQCPDFAIQMTRTQYTGTYQMYNIVTLKIDVSRSLSFMNSKGGNNLFFQTEPDTPWYKVTSSESVSQTITHEAPFTGSVNDYVIGSPVYFTGKVKKYDMMTSEWVSNTGPTDCISEVKPSGTFEEFAGVCVGFNELTNSVIFATHGDFYFKVDDSRAYRVGDLVLHDGSVLGNDEPITVKVMKSVVGKVTAIIDDSTLAILRD